MTSKTEPAEMNEPTNNPNSLFSRFLSTVEWLGNLLPHPVTLFAMLSVFIVLLSGILGYFDIAVADPRPVGAKGREEDGMTPFEWASKRGFYGSPVTRELKKRLNGDVFSLL